MPKNKRKDNYEVQGFNLPPLFSYDPSILSEIRASERGLSDVESDTRRGLKRGRKDLRTQLADLAIDLRRGRTDIRREKRRGLRDIGFQRQDVRTGFRRGQQDLGMRLDELVRSFNTQGVVQGQQANAAGVSGGGTLAASAAARQQNLAFARQPIDIERGRLEEDLERDLERLGVAGRDIRQDARVSRTRLRKDVRHDQRLAKRDFRQFRQDSRTDLQRARREQRIGTLDLIQQAIFQARQLNPGSFSKYGRRN